MSISQQFGTLSRKIPLSQNFFKGCFIFTIKSAGFFVLFCFVLPSTPQYIYVYFNVKVMWLETTHLPAPVVS